MKNTLSLTPLIAFLACGALIPAHGDNSELPVSHVNGLLAVPVAANATTHVGLPFTPVPVTTALEITAKSANSLTVAETIPALVGPHSALIVGGRADGTVLTVASATATVITTVQAVPTAVKADLDHVKIIPNWTLGTLLAGGGGLTGGANAAAADKVAIEVAGVVTEYYYNTGASQWQTVDDAGGSQNDVAIPLQGGIRITRVAGSAIDFVLRGVVRSGVQRAVLTPSANALLSYPFPRSVTLGNSGLADLVAPGADAASADTVVIGGVTYFRAPTGWRLASGGTASQNNVVIPAGAGIEVQRKPSTGTVFPRRWRGSRTMTSLRPKLAAKTNEWVVREAFTAQ
jgi:hypothetical protein